MRKEKHPAIMFVYSCLSLVDSLIGIVTLGHYITDLRVKWIFADFVFDMEEGDLKFAWRNFWNGYGCEINPVSSRTCEHGTNCCIIKHTKNPHCDGNTCTDPDYKGIWINEKV